MEFQTAAQTAERLGCTVRAVQKWAKEGKLSGAHKVGRDWFIPVSAYPKGNAVIENPLPFLGGRFTAGSSLDYINGIENEDERNIALSEYYYYIGETEKSSQICEPYLDSKNSYLCISSALMCIFANMCQHHTHLTFFGAEIIKTELEKLLEESDNQHLIDFAVLCAEQ